MNDRRRVVITGVSGGIGAAAAAEFHERGWTVLGVDVAGTRPAGVDDFCQADISGPAGLDEVLGFVKDFGRVDALVNNAAIQVNHALVDTSDIDWQRVMDTNVGAAFKLIRGLHGELSDSRGAVVNVSSVHAIATSVNVAVYAISKGALAALTRSAALELAGAGIRCNAVLPGAVLTPMLEEGLSRRPHADGREGNLEELRRRTPLGFVALPRQIAPTIVHLADGDLSAYITGQSIIIDGGATIRLGTE